MQKIYISQLPGFIARKYKYTNTQFRAIFSFPLFLKRKKPGQEKKNIHTEKRKIPEPKKQNIFLSFFVEKRTKERRKKKE